MPAPNKKTPPRRRAVAPRQQAAAPRRRAARPGPRVAAAFLIEYRSRNAALPLPQILAWYNNVDPEQNLLQFGHAHVLEKKWHVNGRLTLRMEADSAEALMDAFDFIADPDSDGNYPIEMNGIDVLVVGELLEEIE